MSSAAYRAANRGRIRERDRLYRAANREKRAAYAHALWVERAARLQAIKLESGCVDCGYSEDPARLEFDHRPGTVKLFNVSGGVRNQWTRVLEEIAKCEVRCSWCHGQVTRNRPALSGVD